MLIIYNRTVSHLYLTSFTKLWNLTCIMFFFTLLVLSWLFLHHIVLNSIFKFPGPDSRSIFCSQTQISRSPNVKTHKRWLEPAETSCFKIKALVFESIEPLIWLLLVRSCMTSWVSFSRVISVGYFLYCQSTTATAIIIIIIIITVLCASLNAELSHISGLKSKHNTNSEHKQLPSTKQEQLYICS